MYVISLLCSQSLAEECYREWNHPICQHYLALRQVSDVINGKSKGGGGMAVNVDKSLMALMVSVQCIVDHSKC